ncbi:GvpL/GvpF family gas vesicle protein [Ktedonospora formicarum]|uniref:Protein gvpF n=1 Tax=Ktedonospora formicarum TaxID=2778364 RepID=A0A8J3I7X8_9CHLR|nr:GvpL/GvpF family gas vesicle protein [Ktedonospora formicarum]GHO49111.1 protein gvpF [Ktedonospora formicarum]
MNNEEGRYLYGILADGAKKELGPIGIGGRDDLVYTLPYQDIAAVISCSPVVKYPVTRDNALAHAKVLDKAVEEGTVLPVKFCTIAESEGAIIEKVLKDRYQEFVDLLKDMSDKMEFGIRALWRDKDATYAEIVEEHKDIKTLKGKLEKEKDKQKKYAGAVQVGELVQKALEEKKKKEATALLETLKPLSLKWKENQVYGDMNIVNAAFLTLRERESAFDEKVHSLGEEYGERKQLKYTSSLVPYNFVEIVIHW